MIKYKLSAKLKRRVKRHLKRWGFGLPLYLGRKLLLTTEQKQKARIIKNKINKNEYPLFEYMLV